jgi:hypothetical protein
MTIWQVLEINPTANVSDIRQAYAKKIRVCKPESDPEGFKSLRYAYEEAMKYAESGAEVASPNSTESPSQALSESNEVPGYDHNDLVFYVLDKLEQSESDAINALDQMCHDGALDNLEFSEAFQRSLAFNFLTIATPFENLLSYCVKLFDWENKRDSKSYFGVAVSNLVNSLKPYRFYEYLHSLTSIKNKLAAQKLKIDWEECSAAKMLLKKNNIFKLHSLSWFKRHNIQIATDLLLHIVVNYPGLLTKGINIQTASWLLDYKYNNKLRKLSLLVLTLLAIAITVAINSDFFKMR